MFVDEARICVVGGRGGHGRVSFRTVGRDRYKRRPTGGNGGWGGDVFLKATARMRTLFPFTKQVHWKGENGVHGGTNSCHGKSGKSCLVNVPVGTVVKDLRTQEVLADLTTAGQQLLIARGGLGGRGNESFLSNRYKSPRISELGERGEEYWLSLELRLLADVGLIGFPNAGKSTLISSLSSAKPKVGAYPFTTLEPKLGVVSQGYQEFVAVDIPGLIEGAHEGKGLGARFLKHVERTRLLVHLVDLSGWDGRDPLDDHEKINRELASFSPVLAQKPQILVGTKVDLVDEAAVQQHVERFKEHGLELLPVSGVTGLGTKQLIQRCFEQLEALDQAEPALEEQADGEVRVYRFEPEVAWEVVEEADGFRVQGTRVKRLGLLRLDTDDALYYLHEQLERLGILAELEQRGATAKDTIYIGDNLFEFSREPSPQR